MNGELYIEEKKNTSATLHSTSSSDTDCNLHTESKCDWVGPCKCYGNVPSMKCDI